MLLNLAAWPDSSELPIVLSGSQTDSTDSMAVSGCEVNSWWENVLEAEAIEVRKGCIY